MKKNLGNTDRIARMLLGVLIAIFCFNDQISGTAAIILGVLAIIFIATGFIGFCPLYLLLGFSTRKKSAQQ